MKYIYNNFDFINPNEISKIKETEVEMQQLMVSETVRYLIKSCDTFIFEYEIKYVNLHSYK